MMYNSYYLLTICPFLYEEVSRNASLSWGIAKLLLLVFFQVREIHGVDFTHILWYSHSVQNYKGDKMWHVAS